MPDDRKQSRSVVLRPATYNHMQNEPFRSPICDVWLHFVQKPRPPGRMDTF